MGGPLIGQLKHSLTQNKNKISPNGIRGVLKVSTTNDNNKNNNNKNDLSDASTDCERLWSAASESCDEEFIPFSPRINNINNNINNINNNINNNIDKDLVLKTARFSTTTLEDKRQEEKNSVESNFDDDVFGGSVILNEIMRNDLSIRSDIINNNDDNKNNIQQINNKSERIFNSFKNNSSVNIPLITVQFSDDKFRNNNNNNNLEISKVHPMSATEADARTAYRQAVVQFEDTNNQINNKNNNNRRSILISDFYHKNNKNYDNNNFVSPIDLCDSKVSSSVLPKNKRRVQITTIFPPSIAGCPSFRDRKNPKHEFNLSPAQFLAEARNHPVSSINNSSIVQNYYSPLKRNSCSLPVRRQSKFLMDQSATGMASARQPDYNKLTSRDNDEDIKEINSLERSFSLGSFTTVSELDKLILELNRSPRYRNSRINKFRSGCC